MSLRCPECQADNSDDSRFCKRCATPLPLPVPEDLAKAATLVYPPPSLELTPGTTLADRYLVIEELGKGGMGKVYKVLDQEIKEKVALKLIKPEIAADRQTIDRFQNEIKITPRLGIIHRDLKPQNIMIDEEGDVRIMDFGIASSMETKGATLPGMIMGTPEYMSPEQIA